MAKKSQEEWEGKDYLAEYQEMLNDRSDMDTVAQDVSDYILPGRGVFNSTSRPAPRRYTNSKVVNPEAKEALKVMVSGLYGWLTPPTKQWFSQDFEDKTLNSYPILKKWMYSAQKKLMYQLSNSNFYQARSAAYIELSGFGNGCTYIGEDGDPFRFETLTWGEYVFSAGSDGVVNRLYRPVFRTGQMLIDDYEDKLPEEMQRKNADPAFLHDYFTCLECTVPLKHGNGMPFTKFVFLLNGTGKTGTPSGDAGPIELERSGYHEFPYVVSRGEVVGSDTYGIGSGADAVADVMRLQQMEKSASMAVHKDVLPPLFVPAHLRGKVDSLPGGITYSRNTMNEKATTLYDKPFNYAGVMGFVDRVEQRIKRTFYNDIFLSASRDPNASPLKAAQVNKLDQEGMLRVGPMIGSIFHEDLKPLLIRCFNIMLRKNLFDPLPPELLKIVKKQSYDIKLTSVLAQLQKQVGAQPLITFLQHTQAVAAIKPEAFDRVDVDASIEELHDMDGAPATVLVGLEQAQAARKQRAERAAQAQKDQKAMAVQQMQNQTNESQATVASDMSDAGVNMQEALGGEEVY